MKVAHYQTGYQKRLIGLAVALSLVAVMVLGTPALAAPALTLSPVSGAVGTKVMITGTVFDSYKGDNIHIFFDNKEINSLEVPQAGTFSIPFVIPDGTTPGRHWIEARSETSSTSMLAKNFFIVEEPAMTLDVRDGPVSTDVIISGQGFYAGRTVTLNYYNIIADIIGTVVASPVGEFSYRFVVPDSTGGIHRIAASNAEGDAAEADFEVIPAMDVNRTSGGPGELLTVSGNGFGYRSDVNINFGTRAVATARADDYGSFEVVFNVPEMKSNVYDIKAEDSQGNVDKVKFTVTAGANLSQTGGAVGSRITVRGSGFAPDKPVTLDYDNLRVGTATADSNGAFNVSFNIPASPSGNHVITVSDGTTTKQFAFNVESVTPPVPALLLPANSSETRARAYLDWQDVTDPSLPVVYSLQLASDQNFSAMVLEKTGLTASEYTLTDEERLAAPARVAPYFWRVRATDSAGNQSEWSLPWTFSVNAPPAPSLLQPPPDGQVAMPLFLNWQAVTSLSPPVTYDLQIAADLNFTSIAIEKKGLEGSEYLLSEEEELGLKKKVPYYWRVKATDAAGNGSEWSAPASFHVGSPFTFPGWAIYLLIGIAVIIVGFLAFRVGRRTAYAPPE